MKRMHSFLKSIVCFVLIACTLLPISAAAVDVGTASDSAAAVSAESAAPGLDSAQRQINYNFLRLVRPDMNEKITKGSKLYIKFKIRDTWARYYTRPVVYIYNSKNKLVFSSYVGTNVKTYGTWTRSGYLNTTKLPKGKYKLVIYAAPSYSTGKLVTGWKNLSNIPYDYNYFYIK